MCWFGVVGCCCQRNSDRKAAAIGVEKGMIMAAKGTAIKKEDSSEAWNSSVKCGMESMGTIVFSHRKECIEWQSIDIIEVAWWDAKCAPGLVGR